MKLRNILISAVSALVALSACQKVSDYQFDPKPRNVGEEILVVGSEEIAFPARGGEMKFTVSASYDGSITAPEWVTLSTDIFPGDNTEYTIIASAVASTEDQSGEIVVKTRSLEKIVRISKEKYIRPDIPNPITTAEQLVFFFKDCAPAVETDETVALGADIDLGSVKDFTSAASFVGTFDGAGHTISGLKSSKPLFDNNNGTVKNLIIGESCEFTVPAGVDNFGPFAGGNYGVIQACVNEADIILTDSYTAKVRVGGITGHHYEGKITSCCNYGEIKFNATSCADNALIGGIAGYSEGSFEDCHNYGPVTCNPAAMAGTYYIGGISPRHSLGSIKACVNHKDAKIHASETYSGGKGYIGGIVGYMDARPECTDCGSYADIEILPAKEMYIGGLQAWQTKVTDAAFTMFDNSIVNCNITAYTKCAPKNGGENPCASAGLVMGRFSGQSNAVVCSFGSTDKPISVSGSITSTQTGTKVVAGSKSYGPLVCGDGSGSNLNAAASTWQVFNCIYKVVNEDGEAPAPEDIIVKGDQLKFTVPSEGGSVAFNVRGNYKLTVTADEWLIPSVTEIEGDSEYHEITVTADANDHTYERTGKVTVTMPLGTSETILIVQAGNKNLPESITVTPETLQLDPAGMEASVLTVTANYDATVTSDVDWVTTDPAVVTGDETAKTLKVLASKNKTGAARTATLTLTLPKGLQKTVALTQDKFVAKPLAEIATAEDFVDFISNAFDPEMYPSTFTTKLTKDIDLKGRTLDLVSTYAGTLDGQGHSIRNWASAAPLFTELTGKVANLKIDATCSTNAKTNIAYIAVNNRGIIENCTNNAAVKSTDVPEAATRIAAFADYNYGTITGCTNNGAVTFEPSTTGGIATYIAGITCTVSGGTVENCTNNAKVAFAPAALTAKAYQRVGGIASICVKNTNSTIRGCVNTKNAPVSINDPAGLVTNAYAGGMVAEIEAKGAKVLEGCSSFGDITTNVNNDNSKVGGLVGTISKYSVTGTVLMNGCVVNCSVTGVFKTTKAVVYNFLNSCGMIVGRLGGESGNTLSVGSVESPVKVSGTISMTGAEPQSVTISAENLGNYAVGNGSGVSTTSGFEYQIINAKYEPVTKQ